MYALVDCNNFFVSCERVFRPELSNQPVVVLSNNDGCVISRSEEAKSLGIPMGAPEFQYRELISSNNVVVFSSNYALYGDLSKRVMSVLSDFTPNIEVYSIDEAFLKFEKLSVNFEEIGAKLTSRIMKWIGIPVCVGFAETKALAKIANRIAKKFKLRTNGIYVIDTEEKRLKALKWTKIEDVWGIGRRLSKKMQAKNIRTAYDFTLPENEMFVKQVMGIVGLRLRKELLGESIMFLEDTLETKKNIVVTRSFEKTISDFNNLKERVSTFATIGSEKLRSQKSCCYGISLYLLKKCDIKDRRFSYNIKYVNLPYATQSALTLSQEAIKMLKEMYVEGEKYSKAGIFISSIIPQENKQFSLFEEENPKHEKIMKVMDQIRMRTGERKIRLANQDLNRTWKMKQNHLSNRYTTKLNEILIVKC